MSYLTPVQAVPTLPPTIIYEEAQYPLKNQLQDLYTQIADVVNLKASNEIHQLNQLPTNDFWVDGRTIFTKTIATGTLAQGATNTIAHGITGFMTLVKHEIAVTNGTNQRMLPYANPTAADSAAVDVNATNVVITTGASFGAGYSGFITLFYTTT